MPKPDGAAPVLPYKKLCAHRQAGATARS